jgi:hypothetical protein
LLLLKYKIPAQFAEMTMDYPAFNGIFTINAIIYRKRTHNIQLPEAARLTKNYRSSVAGGDTIGQQFGRKAIKHCFVH